MPTYEYRCTECGERLEVVQSFADDPLTVCPRCEGRLKKVFNSPGISFKGSGFYKTDSRSTSSSSASAGSASESSAADAGGAGSSADGGSSSGPPSGDASPSNPSSPVSS
jgi:putative FmdB family regulatory protein